jgi:phosphocarrier protein HPr
VIRDAIDTMITTKLTVVNKLGLHARAAAKLATTCARFSSNIRIAVNRQTADGKGIMSLMLLAAAKGSELELMVEGKDEQQATEAITRLITDRFGEHE